MSSTSVVLSGPAVRNTAGADSAERPDREGAAVRAISYPVMVGSPAGRSHSSRTAAASPGAASATAPIDWMSATATDAEGAAGRGAGAAEALAGADQGDAPCPAAPAARTWYSYSTPADTRASS